MSKRHVVDFRTPKTIEEVATALGISRDLLMRIVDATDSPGLLEHMYVEHRIPKRRTKHERFRVVWAPISSEVRDAHRTLARRFDNFAREVVAAYPHPAAYGYVRGRNTRQNAQQHCGHKKLLRADIENFFPTISRNRLIGRFLEIGIQQPTAEILSAMATIHGGLAVGLNASPMLANLVCTNLDDKLQKLAAKHGVVYSRYADDIAMSGDDIPTRIELSSIVESEGFRLAPHKFRVTTRGQAHFVTGLSVSDPKAPHVPRRFKRQLRQELYYCKQFGVAGHLERISERSYQRGVNRIDGTVRYVASIESDMADRIRDAWNEILAVDPARVGYSPRHDFVGVDATILIDEAELERGGEKYLALSCVATEQPAMLAMAASMLLREYQADPFSQGRKGKIDSKGLHFSDSSEELRGQFIPLLSYLPFRGYVAFAKLRDTEYSKLYLTLLAKILPRRFKAYDRSRVTLVFEENTKLNRAMLERAVNSAYDELTAANDRRPIVRPTVVVGSKQQHPAFAVPDFLLGVLSRYLSVKPRDVDRLRFERLRDKYRHIIDSDSGEIFSRRNPLEV